MESIEERELLLAQLTEYLEELRETGVNELYYAPEGAALPAAPVAAVLCPDALHEVADEDEPPPYDPDEMLATPVAAAEPEASPAAAPSAAAVARPSAQPAEPGRARVPKLFRAIGNPRAKFFLVMNGEGFQGDAGDLLAKIIQAMGFTGKEVCLLCFAAVPPMGEDLRASLLHAITASRPEIVVTLGTPATRLLLQDDAPIQDLRGRIFEVEGIKFLPTLHPEALLRDPGLKRPVWDDMQQVMRLFGKKRD
ncbi:uracil-DNA glycosylase [Geomesophilobacter sediminis]|uniref:Uracil-DNA glycosylase n=1 Tax=Geomesophilobacter sediminis TaxID=2798584 RepID=A0A8J7LU10_9BACT|nr:uracil-DNA glycosylase [Geomesophilobacter sediminis]MBJ6723220.1 uracil-DNA glycosylase [Geomesophilobacter sediminis]